MSDYLWDKTGEPEEDVKRLEELLGQLRFQPRTFEVPATLPVVTRRAPRAISRFSRPRLAVAASLLLALLAGAWLVFTKQKTTNAPPRIADSAQRGGAATQPAEKTTPPDANQLADVQTAGDAAGVKIVDARRGAVEQIEAAEPMRRARREFVAAQKRPAAPPRQSSERGVSAPREQVAAGPRADATATLKPEEREALEKFVLAMRVTSEKLNYAERQVQSMRESSPQR